VSALLKSDVFIDREGERVMKEWGHSLADSLKPKNQQHPSRLLVGGRDWMGIIAGLLVGDRGAGNAGCASIDILMYIRLSSTAAQGL